MGTLFALCLPDSSTPGSTPAKPTMELRRGKRRTSPISAISCAAVIFPTPYMAHTVSYSGSWDASRVISRPQSGQRGLSRQKLLSSRDNEQLCVLVFRQCRKMATASGVNVQRLLCTEMVSLAFAPLLVTFCKRLFAGTADAIAMPEGHDKIHPFLVAVSTLWAGEKLVYTGKGLVGQRNEIVLQRHHCFHVEIVLAAAQLQLLSNRIHGSIFPQIHPVVKAILCNLQERQPCRS